MATLLTKKSDTASSVPLAGDLTNAAGGAELAVNTADKKLYVKNSSGTVVELTGLKPTDIGVLVQAYDAELSTLAGMSSSRATYLASTEGFGFRNRIINGDMRIDQRNAGAQVTSSQGYTLDRWTVNSGGGALFNVQQDTTVPTGFNNSLKITVGTADGSLAAGDYGQLYQVIEGFNVADLGWGTATAQTVTLSFWVRASVTGTYSGGLVNSAENRSYVFTYSVSAANTWEQKTVTIAGDTSGTWVTNNGKGVNVKWDLGSGSTYQATAGSWVASHSFATSGSVKLSATAGATFYITGVQLEAGSVASPFERRDYGRELMMCQRYFEKSYDDGVAPGASTFSGIVGGLVAFSATSRSISIPFKVTKRASATVSYWDGVGNASKTSDRSTSSWTNNQTGNAPAVISATGFLIDGTGYTAFLQYTSSSEL